MNIKIQKNKNGKNMKSITTATGRVKPNNIRYIAVHSTQSRPGELPARNDFHYVITTSGDILHPQKIKPEDGCVSVAYVGGLDASGRPANTMNYRQQDALYGLLIQLSARFKTAQIKGANELYTNPLDTGFDVKGWMGAFTPRLTTAA
jgi:hypothetical protein